MNLINRARTLPGLAVGAGLHAARLPLTAYERVARRGRDGDVWAPALAFDAVDATVRQAVGGLLRDDRLVRRGRLERAAVNELNRAARLETLAEEERREADVRLAERREEAEERRRQAAERTSARKQEVEREKRQRTSAARERAQDKRQQVRTTEAAVEKSLDEQERAAEKARVHAELRAVAAERDAVTREGEVIDLDKRIDGSKSARAADGS